MRGVVRGHAADPVDDSVAIRDQRRSLQRRPVGQFLPGGAVVEIETAERADDVVSAVRVRATDVAAVDVEPAAAAAGAEAGDRLGQQRLTFDGRGGRVESRWSGGIGVLHLLPATRIHVHRRSVTYAPRFVTAVR